MAVIQKVINGKNQRENLVVVEGGRIMSADDTNRLLETYEVPGFPVAIVDNKYNLRFKEA